MLTRLTLALASLLFLSRADAQRCDPPRVLFAFDQSSSMRGGLPDGNTKWEAARAALTEMARALEDRAELGLQLFPFPDRCEPGAIVHELAPTRASELVRHLREPPPLGGNFTPMAQTLDVLTTYAPLLAPEHPAHVVLITDGWQWCDPYDASTRFAPVAAVERLRDLGVRVHVVGFGAAVDAIALHRAAIASGSPRDGCDASRSEPSAGRACHHQADDLAELRAALGTIVREVADETCNGFDDDCDGAVDEGFDRDGDGHTRCGTVPGGVDPVLADCDDDDARRSPSASELCNGEDDDCDGVADAGCGCRDGESRRCGGGDGACMAGLQRCIGGTWSVCEGEVLPALVEACDGIDDDCDGTVDELASCGDDASCVEGRCEAVTPIPPEPEPIPEVLPTTPQTMVGGCSCRAASRADVGFWVALALLFVGPRRRRQLEARPISQAALPDGAQRAKRA